MKANINLQLSDKQKIILNDCKIGNGVQYVIVATGRQVGKSTIALVTGTGWCTEHNNFSVGIFLPVAKQCRNLFKRVEKALKELADLKLVTFNKTEMSVTFSNGSSMLFMTSENDNMRSFTFDAVIVDEANFVKNEIWFQGIQPTVAASLSKTNVSGMVGFNGKVLLLSTPKTKTWFYDYVNDSNERTRQHRFTSLEGGIISKEYLDRVRKMTPESTFANEYLGEFLSSGNGLFKYLPCIKLIEDIPDKVAYVAGLDIASKNDYMSLTMQNKSGNVIFQKRWRNQSYEILLQTVKDELVKHGSPIVYLETNGVGQVAFEALRKMYSKTKEWVTTNKSKNNIIQKLMVDFNTDSISILNIDYVKDELDNFTVEWKNNKPTYRGSNGYHDDSVMSLAICNYNIKRGSSTIKPTYINNSRQRYL